jgi:cAMP-binding proteins - catabolite gene activator and regulatory subunit of cAMP-dependent protein kinases
MKINYEDLQKSLLFKGISEEVLEKLFSCISPIVRTVKQNEFVFYAGDEIRSVYFILSGRMHIVDEDFWGNSSIVEAMNSGIVFGEAYVLSSRQQYLVGVVAAEDSVILEMNPEKLFEVCPKGCPYHVQFMQNLLHLISEKIVILTTKLGHIMRRTLREKLLSYLTKCAQINKSDSFSIPYSRQQLADYLCVDRSALSHELSRLQKEGLICYRKNQFELLNVERLRDGS